MDSRPGSDTGAGVSSRGVLVLSGAVLPGRRPRLLPPPAALPRQVLHSLKAPFCIEFRAPVQYVAERPFIPFSQQDPQSDPQE